LNRLHIGLEYVDDLLANFAAAFEWMAPLSAQA
jgi:cystathionine beta-lyase/cystathionine gamma-synthase